MPSSHGPRPTHASIPPNHPCSLRSATSGPPTERIKRSETEDAPSQTTLQAGRWSQSGPRTPSSHAPSIRISLGDGRVLNTTEYRALQEKRAGTSAVRYNDMNDPRKESIPKAKSSVEERHHEQSPSSKDESGKDKSILAEFSPRRIETGSTKRGLARSSAELASLVVQSSPRTTTTAQVSRPFPAADEGKENSNDAQENKAEIDTPTTEGTWNEHGNGNAQAKTETESETETDRETEPTWSFGNLGL
ncbi:hypothetical protein Z517_05106 [Fonsecaea pedrosoi CBS 271.37]|uniref:Uncharacterized protein n=1 Tax=Fonsecaea pedrosoi CBS 271.37 TaxID=1442368 RepID=A0A0D2HC15_9EURO|nr:uncharacterized protein Z517_05106 [Fonsecaea pedrosoi CBS 271.37]KIW82079.1 hypothetical protein Z517_05106 [Fonsecaea pedrosoi CBS 271.37]